MRIDLTSLTSGVLQPRRGAWPAVTAGKGGSGQPLVIVATTICESTAVSGAKVIFYDGIDDTGEVVLPITLLPNESARDIYATDRIGGLEIYQGSVYYKLVSGSIEGSVVIE